MGKKGLSTNERLGDIIHNEKERHAVTPLFVPPQGRDLKPEILRYVHFFPCNIEKLLFLYEIFRNYNNLIRLCDV